MKYSLILALLCLGTAVAQTAPAATTKPSSAATPTQATPVNHPPAGNYIIVGNMYYEQGKYDQAYVAFRAANEIDPLNRAALLGLGRTQVKLRLYAPAITTLKSLTRAAPQDISGYIALSQAYQQQYVGSSDRKTVTDNLSQALNVLKDAETVVASQAGPDRDLNMSKVLNDRGSVYRLMGDAAKAIDAFKQASTLNPDNSLILFNLGDMYSATGDLPQAISSLQQAVITDPRDAYNRAYYAKLLALSGNVTAARPEAAQAAKLAPTNAYAVGEYGVVSYLGKDPVTARTQLNQALALDSLRYPEFYYYLGRIELDAGNLQAARENLTKAAALGSNTPEYLYYLGLSYERSSGPLVSDKKTALDYYQRALNLNPSYQAAQDGLNRLK